MVLKVFSLFCFCFFVVFCLSLPSYHQILATVFIAGKFSCPLSIVFFSDVLPGLVWFCSVNLVVTAGFVADQFI